MPRRAAEVGDKVPVIAAKKRKRIRRGTFRWTSPEAELRVTLVGEDGSEHHPKRSVLVPNGEPHSLDLGDVLADDPAARRAWFLARLEKIEWALVCNSTLSNGPGQRASTCSSLASCAERGSQPSTAGSKRSRQQAMVSTSIGSASAGVRAR